MDCPDMSGNRRYYWALHELTSSSYLLQLMCWELSVSSAVGNNFLFSSPRHDTQHCFLSPSKIKRMNWDKMRRSILYFYFLYLIVCMYFLDVPFIFCRLSNKVNISFLWTLVSISSRAKLFYDL